jgi:hypothetical protein
MLVIHCFFSTEWMRVCEEARIIVFPCVALGKDVSRSHDQALTSWQHCVWSHSKFIDEAFWDSSSLDRMCRLQNWRCRTWMSGRVHDREYQVTKCKFTSVLAALLILRLTAPICRALYPSFSAVFTWSTLQFWTCKRQGSDHHSRVKLVLGPTKPQHFRKR